MIRFYETGDATEMMTFYQGLLPELDRIAEQTQTKNRGLKIKGIGREFPLLDGFSAIALGNVEKKLEPAAC